VTLSDVERKIIGLLIKDPRLSDNQLAKISGIPLKTVNRKRKELEEKGILTYLVSVNNSPTGTGSFTGSQIYQVTFAYGITRKRFFDMLQAAVTDANFKHFRRHISNASLCEHDGHLVLILHIESRVDEDILEIYNSDMVPGLKKVFGESAIHSTVVMNLTHQLLQLHNYVPLMNIERGKIKKDFPIEQIVID
jgi:DNA-binding Lrp family transcriptional regulator